MPALKLLTAPTVEPVTTAEAKTNMRVTSSDDDTFIGTLITAARRYAEQHCRRAFVNQTWDLYLDDWPGDDYIVIPRPPLVSVTHVKYTDSGNTVNTWAAANYIVDSYREPGRVVLGYGISWPTATLRPTSAINVQYVAGYGAAAANVPQEIKQAILLLVAHWYENREAVLVGSISKATEFAVNALLGIDANYNGITNEGW